jgi:hypothetical protein
MRNVLKLFIVALMLGCGVNSFGQVTFGIRAGFNLSTMLAKDDQTNYGDEMNFKMKPGFNVGPTLECPISEMFSFETALLLSTLGVNSEYDYGEGNVKESLSLLYLQIPLTAKAAFDLGGTKLFGAFGPYLGYGLSGKWKSDAYDDEDVKWGTNKEEDHFKRFDAGLHFGAGVMVKVIEISLTYDLGLANIATDTGGGTKEMNRVLALNLGYKFGKK